MTRITPMNFRSAKVLSIPASCPVSKEKISENTSEADFTA